MAIIDDVKAEEAVRRLLLWPGKTPSRDEISTVLAEEEHEFLAPPFRKIAVIAEVSPGKPGVATWPRGDIETSGYRAVGVSIVGELPSLVSHEITVKDEEALLDFEAQRRVRRYIVRPNGISHGWLLEAKGTMVTCFQHETPEHFRLYVCYREKVGV